MEWTVYKFLKTDFLIFKANRTSLIPLVSLSTAIQSIYASSHLIIREMDRTPRANSTANQTIKLNIQELNKQMEIKYKFQLTNYGCCMCIKGCKSDNGAGWKISLISVSFLTFRIFFFIMSIILQWISWFERELWVNQEMKYDTAYDIFQRTQPIVFAL